MKQSVAGTLHRYENYASRFVRARNIEVWLPPGYDGRQRLPVIYMQDGQNLFDPGCAYTGVDWGVDETLARLAEKGEIRAAIVVGLWNSELRWREYMPEKALRTAGESKAKSRFVREQGGTPISDRYLRFLVAEFKALVDATYMTHAGPGDTFLMGSSMGALLSLYALCEYPDLFGGAGCLSTHWPAADGAMLEYLKTALPASGRHRLYFDYGTETLDAAYPPYQRQVDAMLHKRGYQEGRDWITHCFAGSDHSERCWRERLDIPLKFLLGQ